VEVYQGSRYKGRVRPRWHDWLIVLSIVALAVTGVATIWGNEIKHLFSSGPAAPEEAGGKAADQAEPEAIPPAGPAKGPF
jgi:hypothetical protein